MDAMLRLEAPGWDRRPGAATNCSVGVPLAGARLEGVLCFPPWATALVVLVDGGGGREHRSRHLAVAKALNASGIATLAVDLLTGEEHARDQRERRLRFDVAFLTGRLGATIDWARGEGGFGGLPLGVFAEGTAAAAALAADAGGRRIAAVVASSGRPDMAGTALRQVGAPTLMIVGGLDPAWIGLNRKAASQLMAPWSLRVVEGGDHFFETPGALEQVAEAARDWFLDHLK